MTTRNEEAARWFAALRRGVMSLEERAAYNGWIAEPKHAAKLRELESTWALLEMAGPRMTGSAASRPRRPRPARAMMLAVACVASLGIGVMSYGGDTQFWTTLDWSNR